MRTTATNNEPQWRYLAPEERPTITLMMPIHSPGNDLFEIAIDGGSAEIYRFVSRVENTMHLASDRRHVQVKLTINAKKGQESFSLRAVSIIDSATPH